METVLLVIIIASAIAVIVSVLLQEGASQGLSGSIGGGAEGLFGKKKAQGMQGLLSKITLVSSIIFFIAILAFSILAK